MADAFAQVATVTSVTGQNTAKSESSVADANNADAGGSAIVHVGSSWDWDDDKMGICIEIQLLLSEFGDFGDFFETDDLNFGEPPGTAESQALVFPSVDCGDISGSPCTLGIDSSDQRISAASLASLENFNQPSAFTEDIQSSSLDTTKDAKSSFTASHTSALSASKFDYLAKEEALLTFAAEFAAVETSSSEFCTSIFRNPYLPGSERGESSRVTTCTYIYGATPSPPMSVMVEKLEKSSNVKPRNGELVASTTGLPGKLYTCAKCRQKN